MTPSTATCQFHYRTKLALACASTEMFQSLLRDAWGNQTLITATAVVFEGCLSSAGSLMVQTHPRLKDRFTNWHCQWSWQPFSDTKLLLNKWTQVKPASACMAQETGRMKLKSYMVQRYPMAVWCTDEGGNSTQTSPDCSTLSQFIQS